MSDFDMPPLSGSDAPNDEMPFCAVPPCPQFEPSAHEAPNDGIPPALVERFKAWAAGVLRDESPPRGIAAEFLKDVEDAPPEDSGAAGQEDAYTLWAAMTALTQEVKLQGRSFKQLSDSLDPLRDMGAALENVVAAHGESLAEARRIADEALRRRRDTDRDLELKIQRQAQGELLGVLTDLRDRLCRGLENARAGRDAGNSIRITRLDKLLGRGPALRALSEAGDALEKGYTLCLDRLEETLAAYGVRELPCMGLPYDPRTMIAADIVETPEYPEGTVVGVFKTGYVCNGEVFHHAHVKVVRAPRGLAAETKEDEVNGQ